MTTSTRFTSADLEVMPDDGKRYEIIDGELYVTKQPSWAHQAITGRIYAALDEWSTASNRGTTSVAPGVIFAEDDDVAPDVVWVSLERYRAGLDDAGHLRIAPELVVEILSPGPNNIRRDKETKLRLYSRRAVDEYWIVDPVNQTIEVYRRRESILALIETAPVSGSLQGPLLPGFRLQVAKVFQGI